jgi:HJR/Mrr/RecB family endonuclease
MTTVVKASGEKEPYSEIKVRNSIRRAGIPQKIQEEVLRHVETKIYENIHTSEIYKHVIEFLETSPEPFNKTKYTLKQAIMDLGPTGYPFEDYVAEILKTKGYKTQVRQILKGKCVSHEVDVIAEKDGKKILVEAKFHNSPGIKSDVHVSLYTKARFDDLKDNYNLDEAWIVTNTKATTDGIEYALCSGMKIIGWNYPETESLRDLVEKAKLYPITALQSLSQSQKQLLLLHGTVLCKSICLNLNIIKSLDLPMEKQEKAVLELEFLCNANNDPINF